MGAGNSREKERRGRQDGRAQVEAVFRLMMTRQGCVLEAIELDSNEGAIGTE